MKTWDEVKNNLTSMNKLEMEIIEQIADIVHGLIKRREELGWTQQELADKAEVKQSAVARIENSGNIPRMDTLQKLAVAMGQKLQLVVNESD